MLRKFQTKHIFFAIIIGGFIAFVYNTQLSSASDISIPESTTYQESVNWWNESYAFRREISSDQFGLQSFSINHAAFVIDRKSMRNGTDLQIVKDEGGNQFPVSTVVYAPDSTETVIQFDKDSNATYFLYYGAQNPNTTYNSLDENFLASSDIVSIRSEESALFTVVPKSFWYLDDKKNDSIEFKFEVEEPLDEYAESFVIHLDSEELVTASLTGDIISFPINSFGDGVHQVAVVVYSDGKVYRSNSITYTASKPMYVSWTIDWEGIDPTEENIKKMEAIANDYNIPLVHFFNPRVLMFSGITEFRRQEIVDWLLERHSIGDEIGMHMHMQHDMVEFAGVRPKEEEPSWNDDFRGYDTPTTVYSYDELLQIVEWAKSIFTDYNLPEPKGYRAGGWFADETTLKVLEDAGFLYDSSGRKSFPLGTMGLIQPWELDVTSQPYFPSYSDQNKTIEGDEMKLLEIPNNGADSYWSESQELINNFYANYSPGEILNESQIVVYLSHPEWFEVDEPKLRILFDELNSYRYDLDNGPVVFVTLEDYLERTSLTP